jgi:hypothetical protein
MNYRKLGRTASSLPTSDLQPPIDRGITTPQKEKDKGNHPLTVPAGEELK